jgi:hypothetical protein
MGTFKPCYCHAICEFQVNVKLQCITNHCFFHACKNVCCDCWVGLEVASLANHLWPINKLWLDLEGRDLHELTTHWNDAFEYVLDYLHPQAGLLTIVICFQIFQAYMENRKMEVSTSGWHTFHWKTCYNSSIPMYPQSQEPW